MSDPDAMLKSLADEERERRAKGFPRRISLMEDILEEQYDDFGAPLDPRK